MVKLLKLLTPFSSFAVCLRGSVILIWGDSLELLEINKITYSYPLFNPIGQFLDVKDDD